MAEAAGLRDVFDAEYYADQYPDLKAAFGYDEEALFEHFVRHGLSEGRSMSRVLDVRVYRESYQDLEDAFGDDWDAYVDHFFAFGINEKGRREGVLFDPSEYAASYEDIKNAFGDDMRAIVRHYINHGIEEQRTEETSKGYADIAVMRAEEERIAREEAEQAPETTALSERETDKQEMLKLIEEMDQIADDYKNQKIDAGKFYQQAETIASALKEIADKYPERDAMWKEVDRDKVQYIIKKFAEQGGQVIPVIPMG